MTSGAIDVADRYQKVFSRILKAREKSQQHQEVLLVAVSKKQSPDKIRELYRLGHRDFGENYVQELTEKGQLLAEDCPEIRWHLIGHLQTNKVKAALRFAQVIHTVDSIKLARELSKHSAVLPAGRLPIVVFIQVNLDDEESKHGVQPHEAHSLAQAVKALPALHLSGLMCIPNPEGKLSDAFGSLKKLEVQCRPYTLGELSMGMSSDFEIAVEQGASVVRVGSEIFGPRIG